MKLCLLPYAFGLLWSILKTYDVSATVVYLAVLLPNSTKYPFSIYHARPAIDLTITKLQHRGLFTKDTIEVLYNDSRCTPQHGSLGAFHFQSTRRVNVFFGPVCDFTLAQVARLATIWNIPMLSPGGLAHDFGADKQDPEAEFKTLTRVGSNFNSMAEALTTIIWAQKWEKVLMIYEIGGYPEILNRFCYLATSAMIYKTKQSKGRQPFDFFLLQPSHKPAAILTEKIGRDHGGPIQAEFEKFERPIDALFMTYLDDSLENILEQSNLYKNQQQRYHIAAITKSKLLGFIGINVLMGYHRLPAWGHYWCPDPDLGVPLVSETMTRNDLRRFAISITMTIRQCRTTTRTSFTSFGLSLIL